MKNILPYLLPALTIIGLAVALAFLKPQITGLAIASKPEINAEIRITAEEIIPEGSFIRAYIADENNNAISEILNSEIKEVISKYRLSLSYENSANTQINYSGWGYKGTASFNLTSDMGDINARRHKLITEIIYEGKAISSNSQEIN